LEYANREKGHEQPTPLTLLGILDAQPQQSLPLFDLQTRSGMEPGRYAVALKSLRDAGYIVIQGDAPDQTVKLTVSGAGVAQLAKPA
jgi:DNA-binding MarR family transcriptional regulator